MVPTTRPSLLARSVAAVLWPDVQKQRMLCRGAYAFTCAGHGGIVALVSALGLSEEVIQAARDSHLIELLADVDHGNRTRRYCTAAGYSAGKMHEIEVRHPNAVALHEVWIGEEDCDWATLALVSEAVRKGMYRSGYSIEITWQYAYDSVRSSNEKFLQALPASMRNNPEGETNHG